MTVSVNNTITNQPSTGGGGAVSSVAGRTGDVVLTATDVSLGNCNNTSDANKPVSSATQTALNLLAPIASPTFTGTVGGVTATMVGLGNCNNTSDANKPVSSAQLTAIQARGNILTTTTWANRATAIAAVAALTPGNGWVYVSDIGVSGSWWWCNGSTLLRDSPITLYNSYVGLILPSLVAASAATYSQTGTTVTVTSTAHNIPATTNNGKSVYVASATNSGGVAIAAGAYANFQYVDANTFTFTNPTSQSSTGTLVTQTSAVVLPGVSISIPGGLLGSNGWVDAYHMSMCNASAGTKRMSFLYSTFSFKNPSPSSTSLAVSEIHRFQNQNTTNKQIAHAPGSVGLSGPGSVTPSFGAIDSTANQNITVSTTLNTASDYITLEHLVITVQP